MSPTITTFDETAFADTAARMGKRAEQVFAVGSFGPFDLWTDPKQEVPSGDALGEVPPGDTLRKVLSRLQSALGPTPGFSRLSRRLQLLWSESKEEEERGEGAALSLDSTSSFVGWMSQHRTDALPSLFVTPAGNLRAEWRTENKEFLGLEFESASTIFFVIFYADRDLPEGIARLQGKASPQELQELLERRASHLLCRA